MRTQASLRLFCRRLAAPSAILVGVALFLALAPRAHAQPYNPVASQPGFENGRVLPGAAIYYASPVVADLDNDGQKEIIIGGVDGKVHAVRSNGALMWTYDATGPINALAARPGSAHIDSAAAVGDLDNDGWPEVVLSAGAPASVTGYNGGMIVLNHDGKLRAGWPQVGADQIGPNMGGPDGWLEGYYSSPSLADLDGDGDLEIIVGGWDMRFYAWHDNGRLVEGWPRFAGDTVWSSPATGDLDDDGRPEVIIGRDDATGGFLEVLQADGSKEPGFPKSIDQTIYSSPLLADLNGDGKPEIITGTGNFFAGRGLAVYAWDAAGSPVSGWPAATGGYPMGAPSAGDLDGDGDVEIIASANDGKVYAFHGDGRPVAGWPVAVSDNFGNIAPLYNSAPVLANFDADPQPEVFINTHCDTMVIDGNGVLLTHVGNSGASGKPSMYMFNSWCVGATPAIADLDGDGLLEVVRGGAEYNASTGAVGNAKLYVWKASKTLGATAWPMYRRDAEHHATYQPAGTFGARLISQTLPEVVSESDPRTVQITLENTGAQPWTATSGAHLQAAADNTFAPGQRVTLAAGESIQPGQRKTFSFTIRSPGQAGYAMSSWRMADGSGHLFGSSAWRETKVGSVISYYVLSRAGVSTGGLARRLDPPGSFWNWPEARDMVLTSDKRGYELLDSQGGVWQGGTAPAIGGHGFVPGAVELLMRADQTSYYYILDRSGRLTKSGGAPDIAPAPPVQGDAGVRSGVLTADGRGVYVLRGDGTILTGGNAAALAGAPYFGGDIARKIELAPQGQGAYVLDAYGRVWAVGGAPALSPNYTLHLNEDWARDLEIAADGRGYYILDKEGGVYTGGNALPPSSNLTPTWPGQDMALALAVVDCRLPHVLMAIPNKVTVLTIPRQPHTIKLKLQASDQGNTGWRAESSASWAQVQTSSGQTPATLTIDVQPGSMTPGSYSATVTVVSTDGGYPDIVVPVRLVVAAKLYKSVLPLIMR
jgi:hypothetical protein